MTALPRRCQMGYREPTTREWMIGFPAENESAEIGFLDMALEVWALGEPAILSGE